jgi:hypothetical protein
VKEDPCCNAVAVFAPKLPEVGADTVNLIPEINIVLGLVVLTPVTSPVEVVAGKLTFASKGDETFAPLIPKA